MRRLPVDLPHLGPDERFEFPNPRRNPYGDIPVAIGGNLSPGMLLSAYRQGLFPWYENPPILWFSPDPRCVFDLRDLHVPAKMRSLIRKGRFRLTCDHAFDRVIRDCAEFHRRTKSGTWINPQMIEAYIELHRLGYAHSIEVWEDGTLVGGLYGVHLGRMFFGESMYHLRDNASKLAFYALADRLLARGIEIVDSQVANDHTLSLGAVEIGRDDYLVLLTSLVDLAPLDLPWRQEIDPSLPVLFDTSSANGRTP